MDLHSLLKLLRDRWGSILLVTLLATVTAGVLVLRETPMYAAQATLYVASRADPSNPVSAYQGSLLSQQQVASYAALIRSQRVLGAVADGLGRSGGAAALATRVSAEVVPQTALLVVTALDTSPAGAQRLANAVGYRFVAVLPSLEYMQNVDTPAVAVNVVSDAGLPTTPVSPKPARDIGLGALVGLLAGIALAAARQTLDLSVRSLEQAQETVRAPALGALPADPSAGRSPLAIHETTQLGRIEALRKVSASLRFLDVEQRHTVLLVTSPSSGEGKSTTACNLALTLARSGRRVILIDGDLRRPRVAGYLGLPGGVGLTNVLLGSAPLADATQDWGDRLFQVLTSGPVPPNPSEMLGSQRMRELLQRLRQQYDDVVVDAAPVLPVADTTLAAPACDGVIMVAQYGRTRRDHLLQAANTLQEAHTPILGVVLNRVPTRGAGAGYYYYAPRPAPRAKGRRADHSYVAEGAGR